MRRDQHVVVNLKAALAAGANQPRPVPHWN